MYPKLSLVLQCAVLSWLAALTGVCDCILRVVYE
jgi:hypothetical protein